MRFAWDPTKNARNLARHHLDFADAKAVFAQPYLDRYDDRENYGEDRWIAIGFLQDLIITVVYTEPDDDTIHLISARRATPEEANAYLAYRTGR